MNHIIFNEDRFALTYKYQMTGKLVNNFSRWHDFKNPAFKDSHVNFDKLRYYCQKDMGYGV